MDYLKIAEECGGAMRPSEATVMMANDDLARFAERVRGVPEGWKLVPVEPTPEMIDAIDRVMWPGASEKAYRAMLAAAPCPPVGPQDKVLQVSEQSWTPEEMRRLNLKIEEQAARINWLDNRLIGYWTAANNMAEKIEALTQERDRLREALEEAADDIASWGAYASEYFQKKRKLDECVARYRALAAHPKAEPQVAAAARDVLAERQRQISVEGWTPEHDDGHVNDEIAAYAALYLLPEGARDWDASSTGYGDTLGEALMPCGWYMPTFKDRRGQLVKGAALALAEIERLDRAAAHPKAEPRPTLADVQDRIITRLAAESEQVTGCTFKNPYPEHGVEIKAEPQEGERDA